jgi:hypothetical protein
MKIVKGLPPNYDEIIKVFPAVSDMSGIIYAWHDTIYNPDGGKVGDDLIAHETVHARQQAGDPSGWWRLYLENPLFRLQQEIEAHQAEYDYHRGSNRHVRRKMLRSIAKRLSSPMYGDMVTYERARDLIDPPAGFKFPERLKASTWATTFSY